MMCSLPAPAPSACFSPASCASQVFRCCCQSRPRTRIPPLKRLPFGIRGLWAPTLEAFYRRGLLDDIAADNRPQDNFYREIWKFVGYGFITVWAAPRHWEGLAGNPEAFLRYERGELVDSGVIGAEAWRECLRALSDPAAMHGICEDYLAGHYLAEEAPDRVLTELLSFLSASATENRQ